MNLVILSLIFILNCTNYSSSKTNTVPPILVGINPIKDTTNNILGYEIALRGGNPELLFTGYKLYIANTADSAKNPSDLKSGLNCDGNALLMIPNAPLQYSIMVGSSPAALTGTYGNRVCNYTTTITSGQYIAIRAMLLSIQFGNNSISPSQPSNSIIVP